jgi:uncharacterized protein (DUF1684 family)
VTAAEHAAEVAVFREARLRRLGSPDGWLSLVDKIAIDDAPITLPPGTFARRGADVLFEPRAGASVTCNGAPAGARVLAPDEPGPPDTLACDGRSYQVIRRGAWLAVRVRDPASVALAAFRARGLDAYAVDARWRIEAPFEAYHPPRSVVHQFDVGPGEPQPCPGAALVTLDGRVFRLEPTLEGGRLFFIFGDETNRDDSYPGGRFLYARAAVADRVILDFNQAFNPPCAFTPFATCPRVPPGHRLPVRIEAGEKRYLG